MAAVYRNYEITPEDTGMSRMTNEEIQQIFGKENDANIYTGQMTHVSPCERVFEHNINTSRGCSGAIIFLLDMDQDGFGVDSSDYGKAVDVNVGDQRLADGTIVKFGSGIK